MKNSGTNIFIIVLGVFIIIVFSVVLKTNLNSKYESNSYYAKTSLSSAKIDSYLMKNGKLSILTSNAKAICVKTTKSLPEANHICWKNVVNNKTEVSVYQNKEYYVWVKDSNDVLSTEKRIYTR